MSGLCIALVLALAFALIVLLLLPNDDHKEGGS